MNVLTQEDYVKNNDEDQITDALNKISDILHCNMGPPHFFSSTVFILDTVLDENALSVIANPTFYNFTHLFMLMVILYHHYANFDCILTIVSIVSHD